MAQETGPIVKGMVQAPNARGLGMPEWLAIVAGVLWVVYAILSAGNGAYLSTTGIAVLALVVVATMAHTLRAMRHETARLVAVVESMHINLQSDLRQGQGGLQPSVAQKLDEIATTARSTETAVAMFTSQRQVPTPPAPRPMGDDSQAVLKLGLDANAPNTPVSPDDLIRALNFPENEDDKAGFAALRNALADRTAQRLVRTCQTILTQLSEDGIYMDDLRSDPARPFLWRRFAHGERGGMVAGLASIRDRSALALSAGRMRQDVVFRDTVHDFLRQFDDMVQTFEPNASDSELAALTNTRSAKAFVLLGRVTRVFD